MMSSLQKLTPLDLLFNGIFHVDNKLRVENMHILANMRSKFYIKGRLIISSRVCHYLGNDKGRGVRVNGDKV